MYSALCATCSRCLKKFKTTVQKRVFDSCGIYTTFWFAFFFFLVLTKHTHSCESVDIWVSHQRHLLQSTMPVQAPQWTEFLLCPICTQTFEENVRKPISLGCGHTVCKMCLNKLHRKACPFDQTTISTDIELLPVNTALLQLVCPQVSFSRLLASPRIKNDDINVAINVAQISLLTILFIFDKLAIYSFKQVSNFG